MWKSPEASRRSSVSLPARPAAPRRERRPVTSAHGTPTRTSRNTNLSVTGRQILNKSDRANSVPGPRRPSLEAMRGKPPADPTTRGNTHNNTQNTSLDDDMTLDLTKVSDLEDSISKYGLKDTFVALATSTPLATAHDATDSQSEREETVTSHDDSLSMASTYKGVMREAGEWSASPECSAGSSSDLSTVHTPHTHSVMLRAAPCAVCGCTRRRYDHCPTPYATDDTLDPLRGYADISECGCCDRSPGDVSRLRGVLRAEGLSLTPRETHRVLECARLLTGVLSEAAQRRVARTPPAPRASSTDRQTLTLDLHHTAAPAPPPPPPPPTTETATTQTDISLPNTRSAPRIFESILRQLSKSSLDDTNRKDDKKDDRKAETTDSKEVQNKEK